MTSDLTDLHGLSRDVARASAAWAKYARDLATRSDPDALTDYDPIEPWRQVAGKTTYDALGERAPSALDVPLRDGLRRSIYALTQARTGRDLLVEAATEAVDASARLEVLVPRLVSWRDAWRGTVAAPTRTERRAFLAAAAERGPVLASLARRRAERRVEVAQRLGLVHPAALALVFPDKSLALRDLAAAARALLDRTDDVAAAVFREGRARREDEGAPDPTDAIALAVARDAPEGWPAQSIARWLDETVGHFARGLRIELPPLPEPVGASTFARALGAFGNALRESGPSPSLPFVVAHDPYPTSAHTFARVFAALPATVPFQRRALGNGARVADAQARVLARAALVDARLAAARLLLTDDAARADAALFEELTTRVLGAPLPASLSGAWPAARDDEPSRFLGLLGAPALARDLVDRFDDDWFRNPSAVRHLRALASAPARHGEAPGDAAALHATVASLARRFEEALAASGVDAAWLRAGARGVAGLGAEARRHACRAQRRAPVPPSRAAALPTLPSVPRVRIQVAKDHVVVVEEVNLPRGDWQSGDLDFYVAFGAPGAPQAFDAHLVPVADGALEPEAADPGEPVAVERAPRRPPNAQPLLGPAQMAGAVLHVKDAAFRRAVASGNMAALRLRTLLTLPEEDARTGREIVVRLGASRGTPLTLGRVQVAAHDARPRVTRAEAHLCGTEADPYPLAIALASRPAAPLALAEPASAPIAPVLSVRHATDDLCVRFWTE